jgi:hypothetical protein
LQVAAHNRIPATRRDTTVATAVIIVGITVVAGLITQIEFAYVLTQISVATARRPAGGRTTIRVAFVPVITNLAASKDTIAATDGVAIGVTFVLFICITVVAEFKILMICLQVIAQNSVAAARRLTGVSAGISVELVAVIATFAALPHPVAAALGKAVSRATVVGARVAVITFFNHPKTVALGHSPGVPCGDTGIGTLWAPATRGRYIAVS